VLHIGLGCGKQQALRSEAHETVVNSCAMYLCVCVRVINVLPFFLQEFKRARQEEAVHTHGAALVGCSRDAFVRSLLAQSDLAFTSTGRWCVHTCVFVCICVCTQACVHGWFNACAVCVYVRVCMCVRRFACIRYSLSLCCAL